MRPIARIVVWYVLGFYVVLFGSEVQGGSFTSLAVDLSGRPIADATIEVLSEQGFPLNRSPASFNRETGQYRVEVDNADLNRLSISNVSIRFSAPGRETVTLTRILGTTNQRIDVVMPEAAGAIPPSASVSSAPSIYPPCSNPCCPAPCRRSFWRWRR